jgi:hypothetical protein
VRRLILGLAVATAALVSVPAPHADAQWMPGYPPMPGGGMGLLPGMPAGTALSGGSPAGTVDSSATCQAAIAQAAYPIANQMVTFTVAANNYPMTPNGRPVIAPTFGYPGFFGFAGPGRAFGTANTLLAGGLSGLNSLPPGTSPAAVLNALAGAPGGLTLGVGPLGAGDLLGVAGLQQGQVGNILAAIDTQQGVLGTRFGAAQLNAAFTAFPRQQAALLKEVLEGLTFYRDLACPSDSGSRSSGGNNNEASMNENNNSNNGHRH